MRPGPKPGTAGASCMRARKARWTKTTMQRWAAKVVLPSDPDGCWLWTGGSTSEGYGQFHDGRHVLAHRWGYEKFIGPISSGMTLDHFRMNPGPQEAPCSKACVHPAHVEPVTHRENVIRGRTTQHAKPTHCPSGHEYAGDNLILRKTGVRVCRTCKRVAQSRYEKRIKSWTRGV